jgi:predicted cupin superfamily sugar epimerase
VSETGADATEAKATAQALAIAAALQLEPLPLEGGLFRRTFTGGGATAILFMLIGADFSALHRLTGDEVYFHHRGAPLRMLLIEPDGAHHEVLVGSDVAAGEQPQLHVPAGWWQGSSAAGSWSLVSTVVSPGFDWHGFTLGDRGELAALAPAAVGRIAELTRADPSR